VDKNYTNPLADVNNLMDTTDCCVLDQNMEMKKNYKAQAGIKLGNMEKERNLLLEEKKK
jgi:hypothetical protein